MPETPVMIAERIFKAVPRQSTPSGAGVLHLRIFRPAPRNVSGTGALPWGCQVQTDGVEQNSVEAEGSDSYQALEFALAAATVLLIRIDEKYDLLSEVSSDSYYGTHLVSQSQDSQPRATFHTLFHSLISEKSGLLWQKSDR